MQRVPVFEYLDMPQVFRDMLVEYHNRNKDSHCHDVYPGSYTRYPLLFDFDWNEDKPTELDNYFFSIGLQHDDPYLIIYWDN